MVPLLRAFPPHTTTAKTAGEFISTAYIIIVKICRFIKVSNLSTWAQMLYYRVIGESKSNQLKINGGAPGEKSLGAE